MKKLLSVIALLALAILPAYGQVGGGVTSPAATLAALGAAPLASPTFTGTVTIPSPFTLGSTSVTSTGTQFNYLSGATGTTGTNTTNVVFSASPTFTGVVTLPASTSLITPVLGAATGTSLVLSGTATVNNLISTSGLTIASAGRYVQRDGGTVIDLTATDGLLILSNFAVNDFNRVTFGGTTSSFPALARDSAGLKVVAADGTTGTFLSGVEQTAPAAPAANGYRIFSQDNGAGKTQLMVIFSSGAAQQLAIQP